MSSKLFGRQVVVQLGTANATGKEYTQLRTRFTVTMTDSSEPNTARIELYNPVGSIVSTMQADDAVVRLLVGYESQGGVPRLLFQGNPIAGGVKMPKQGVDAILTIEAADGGREYSSSHLTVSFSTGVDSGQIFATLADSLGVALGNVDAIDSTVSFPHGLVLTGRASDALDRIAELSGAQWQIRDGTLQVWKTGESTGEAAVVFSAEAGNLIGSPALTDDGVAITGLLAPTLRPGKPFRVKSRDIEGDYVATAVEFRGDSGWGPDFYVIAKGTPL